MPKLDIGVAGRGTACIVDQTVAGLQIQRIVDAVGGTQTEYWGTTWALAGVSGIIGGEVTHNAKLTQQGNLLGQWLERGKTEAVQPSARQVLPSTLAFPNQS